MSKKKELEQVETVGVETEEVVDNTTTETAETTDSTLPFRITNVEGFDPGKIYAVNLTMIDSLSVEQREELMKLVVSEFERNGIRVLVFDADVVRLEGAFVKNTTEETTEQEVKE